MPSPTEWTQGQTAPETYVLEETDANGDLQPVDVSGLTVDLVLKDKTGTLVTTTGDVAIVSGPAGTVKYTPDSTDLDAALSPYSAKFKVTFGDGSIRFYPQGPPMTWKVYPQ